MAPLLPLKRASLGDPRVVVAVLDGPVDRTHPCFQGAEWIASPSNEAASPSSGAALEHGTHVASLVFGQPGSPVEGLAPRCRGLLLPIYGSQAAGEPACSHFDLARAIDLAVEHGAHVINVSGGEPGGEASVEPILAHSIRRAAERGSLVVAAAGNDGCACVHVPAGLPSVLAVGATDDEGRPLDTSNWGAIYRQQGILAPGWQVHGALPGGQAGRRSGSSFATAHVTGVVALLLSLQVAAGHAPNPRHIAQVLIETAEPCDLSRTDDCRRWLAGRLDPEAALNRILELAAGPRGTRRVIPSLVLPAAASRNHSVETYRQPPSNQRKAIAMTESTESVIPQTPAASTAAPERAEPALLADSESTATATPVAEVGVRPSACACGGGTAGAPPAALVYALGQIGYDFGSEARRDSLLQQSGRNVQDPGQWLACLKADPASAASVIWTLNLDATPVYAVVPAGPFAADGYLRLREFLESQLSEGAERVSVPGVLRGSIRLINGQLVPVIIPEVRGMYSWTTSALLQSVLGSTSKKREDAARQAAQGAAVQNFLERIYYEVRNLGVTSPDRAMNFAATNAFQVRTAFESALEGGFKLDRIEAERSVICRPGSDCWDVKLTFFHPSRRLEEARRMHRFTVDVSDVVPVTVGKPRQWEVY